MVSVKKDQEISLSDSILLELSAIEEPSSKKFQTLMKNFKTL